MKCTINKD
jgi:hypothetical protein